LAINDLPLTGREERSASRVNSRSDDAESPRIRRETGGTSHGRDGQKDRMRLGTDGRSGVGKLLLGSVAQRIFNVVPCPVLTVSPRAGKSWGAVGKFARILYPTDFSRGLSPTPFRWPGSLKLS